MFKKINMEEDKVVESVDVQDEIFALCTNPSDRNILATGTLIIACKRTHNSLPA